MGIMRSIIKWCDNKMDEAYVEDNNFKCICKAGASGFVEGFCDAAVIMYPILVTTLFIAGMKAKNEE